MKNLSYSEINSLGEYSTFSGSYFPFTITFQDTISAGSYFYFKLFHFDKPEYNVFTISKSISSDLTTGSYTFGIDENEEESIYTTKGLSGKYNFQVYIKSSSTPNSIVSINPVSPAVFTASGNTLQKGQKITLSTTGDMPNPFVENTEYYVKSPNSGNGTFQLASVYEGTSINATNTTQEGIHTVNPIYWYPPSQGVLVVLPSITYNGKYWV